MSLNVSGEVEEFPPEEPALMRKAGVDPKVDKTKDFPVNLEPYTSVDEFKEGEDSPKLSTKIELGKKLVLDAIEKGIQFRELLFNNWYLRKDFISFIKDQKKTGSPLSKAMISFMG